MIYSPVIIPTLNRFYHFKRCLESLERCTGAEFTDVYIGLDYPPSDKYIDGWKDIDNYLQSKELNNNFRSLTVYRRTSNYFSTEIGNAGAIISDIENRYGSYIFSEDDNEFSKNFLLYINKGLELFEYDKDVIAICGCSETDWIKNDKENILKVKLNSGYGIATWIKKNRMVNSECSKFLMDKNNWNLGNFYSLFKNNKCLFTKYINEIIARDDGLFWKNKSTMNVCDTPRSIYMHLTDKCVIVPSVSKSRTYGNDGSGVNMPKIEDKTVELDSSQYFDYCYDKSITFNNKNYKIGNAYLKRATSWKQLLLSMINLLILLCSNKNRNFVKRINKYINHNYHAW